ncbi:flagellar hook-associated protein FlgK [Melioribacteraceae bacterium 4301-Me]|uniref:flagellar hook-associated protein FlgK n=1 Tax=Pyranulibacter aquaticus TaxID=3163344 RepID=UPI003599D45D
MGISRILDISKRSLLTYQNALDVTAHNIANASNPDYSRQRVILSATTPENNAGFYWGSGVTLSSINRMTNDLIVRQLDSYTSKLSYSDKQAELLGQIEQVFSEPSDQGLSALINQFFNSWQSLSVNPSSIPLRNDVLNSAKSLSLKIQDINSNLDLIKSSISSEFRDKVNQINSLLQDIKNLNIQISSVTNSGQSPNDLLDQRDKSINELSKLVDINVIYNNNNSAMISIGGILAVDSNFTVTFDTSLQNGKLNLITTDGKSPIITNGELSALADLYNKNIAGYQNDIDTIANQIVSSVNSLHSTAYSIENPPQTGINFFDGYIDGKLEINPNILSDVRKIAVSSDGTSGNGDIAKTISELADKKLIDGFTLSEKFSTLVNKIGSDKQTMDNLSTSNKLVLDQLQNQKDSVSGVSVDEEMTNVLKFQRAYDASAKLIKIADDLFQTLLDMV